MYAVIKAGGKQQKVKAGDVIEVEYMGADPGDKVTFRPLLLVDDEGKAHYGKDAQKAVVVARLLGEKKGDKVKVFKYRPKTGYARRQGHRQLLTLLEIEDITVRPARTTRAKAGARAGRGRETPPAPGEEAVGAPAHPQAGEGEAAPEGPAGPGSEAAEEEPAEPAPGGE